MARIIFKKKKTYVRNGVVFATYAYLVISKTERLIHVNAKAFHSSESSAVVASEALHSNP